MSGSGEGFQEAEDTTRAPPSAELSQLRPRGPPPASRSCFLRKVSTGRPTPAELDVLPPRAPASGPLPLPLLRHYIFSTLIGGRLEW